MCENTYFIYRDDFFAANIVMVSSFGSVAAIGLLSSPMILQSSFSNLMTHTIPTDGVNFLIFLFVLALPGLLAMSWISHIKDIVDWTSTVENLCDGREICNLKLVSDKLGITHKICLKRCRSAMKRGYIPQGHLDETNTILFVSNDAYGDYLKTREYYQYDNNATSELQSFIDQGSSYLEQIKLINVSISDTLVSTKITKIETVINSIIQNAIEDPNAVTHLNKFINYYLPTTLRLLEAYDKLEDQPAQGDVIAKSRNQVENALDSLCSIFQEMLDSSFEGLSFNVAAEIDVLESMIKQGEFAKSPFSQN